MESICRFIVKCFLKICYKAEFIGFDKFPHTGPALIIANHVSYIDGLFIQTACKRPVRFIIDQYIYESPFINYFMKLSRAIPILPKKDHVEKALDDISFGLENGDAICIFPEGQLTYTGNLGRFKPGIEWVVERDPVPIYPIAVKGLWDSIFSRKYRHSKFKYFPRTFRKKVVIKLGEEIHPNNVHVNKLQRMILDLKNSIE